MRAYVDADRAARAGDAEPVYIQSDHLAKARRAPFLCRVHPAKDRQSGMEPLYAAPQAPKREQEPAPDALQAIKRTALDAMPGAEVAALRSIVGQCIAEQKRLGYATRPDMPCDLPPKGWVCSRGWGHGGPCAASREGGAK